MSLTQRFPLASSLCAALVTFFTFLSVFLPSASKASGLPNFIEITPSIIPFGSDYAYDTHGYGWDFSDVQHFGSELTAPNFRDMSITNGLFIGTTSTSDPKIWLQDLTIPGTIPALNEGGVNPIDTSRYRYLTFRMYSSADDDGIVYWYSDRSFAPGTFGAAGFKPIRSGWHTYTFDLVAERNMGAGGLAWNAGPIQSIAIKPANSAGVLIKLDYVRLTTTLPEVAPVITVRWTSVDSVLDLYFDTDPDGSNATLIARNVAGNTGSYRWVTPYLAPGTYYLLARSSTSQIMESTQIVSPAFEVNTPPVVTILAPSYTSGPDYATTVVGNPWDMSSSDDVKALYNVVDAVFDNGILGAVNDANNPDISRRGDPGIELNVTTPIDPTRFYYGTYRFRLDGTQDIAAGSVVRFLWWTTMNIGASASTTKDILIYEGWRTVTVDFRTALLEPDSHSDWLTSPKVGFRFDPHEFPTPRRFELDYILLTGNDRASTNFTIRYELSEAKKQTTRVEFYYDNDRGGADGVRIDCGAVESNPIRDFNVFLPLVIGSGSLAKTNLQLSDTHCVWDLANVPNGDYYIYAVADDGIDTRLVYSQTPVEVRK